LWGTRETVGGNDDMKGWVLATDFLPFEPAPQTVRVPQTCGVYRSAKEGTRGLGAGFGNGREVSVSGLERVEMEAQACQGRMPAAPGGLETRRVQRWGAADMSAPADMSAMEGARGLGVRFGESGDQAQACQERMPAAPGGLETQRVQRWGAADMSAPADMSAKEGSRGLGARLGNGREVSVSGLERVEIKRRHAKSACSRHPGDWKRGGCRDGVPQICPPQRTCLRWEGREVSVSGLERVEMEAQACQERMPAAPRCAVPRCKVPPQGFVPQYSQNCYRIAHL
jgi:hypothetical protein